MSANAYVPESGFDADGRFHGFTESECGEHRTVGSHRAWCHACTTWCYPEVPCPGCHTPFLEAENERLQQRVTELEEQHEVASERARELFESLTGRNLRLASEKGKLRVLLTSIRQLFVNNHSYASVVSQIDAVLGEPNEDWDFVAKLHPRSTREAICLFYDARPALEAKVEKALLNHGEDGMNGNHGSHQYHYACVLCRQNLPEIARIALDAIFGEGEAT